MSWDGMPLIGKIHDQCEQEPDPGLALCYQEGVINNSSRSTSGYRPIVMAARTAC